jgi:AcrR family transcriptional regulator
MPIRRQLRDAAKQVLADKGPFRFTVIEVCRVAGLNQTTIYKHFEGRDHIVEVPTGRWLDVIAA